MSEDGTTPAAEPQPLRIDPDDLAPATLRQVLEECVTRDGTEHTDVEVKVDQAHAALRSGRAELWFDPATRTCGIRRADG